MATKQPPINLIKVLQALQHVCQKVVPSLNTVITHWHTYQKLSKSPCRQPQVCSRTRGKPKPATSCAECVKWGRVIEAAYYPQPPFIAWKNINTSVLHGSAIEVCNAFALHLPAGRKPAKMSDYDTASILKIILGFGEYHQNNQATQTYADPYQTIRKVSDIRNNLCHMSLHDNLDIDEQTMKACFHDIQQFTHCLQEMQHLTNQEGDDIRTHLNTILTSSVCLTHEMGQAITDVMQKGFDAQNKKLESTLADAIEKILKATGDLQLEVNLGQQLAVQNKKDLEAIKKGNDVDESLELVRREVPIWRERLKRKYKQDKRNIRFGRSRKAVADTEDIFVDLTLLKTPTNQSRKQEQTTLQSYADLFTILCNSSKGDIDNVSHVLLQGSAGSGKTTLVSRIAYLWATGEHACVGDNRKKDLNIEAEVLCDRFDIVFVILLRKLASESLERTIQKQLLPDVSVECIASVIGRLGERCLILFDGYDEVQKGVECHALESPLVSECFGIVTSRPHMVDDFSRSPDKSGYAHVEILGFSVENRDVYIRKFFALRAKPEIGERLIRTISDSHILMTLAAFPILLVMMCLLWEEATMTAFTSTTGLFENALRFLNKPFETRPQLTSETLEKVLIDLGKPAFDALLQNKLQIPAESFHRASLSHSFDIGLTTEEEGPLPNQVNVIFIHKTFQEFCAAKYLANLFLKDADMFWSQLKSSVSVQCVLYLQLALQFCCSLCPVATKHIVRYLYNGYDIKLPLLLSYESDVHNGTSNSLDDFQPLNDLKACQIYGNDYLVAFCHFALLKQHVSNSWFSKVTKVDIATCKIYHLSRIITSLWCIPTLMFLYLRYCVFVTEKSDESGRCLARLWYLHVESCTVDGSSMQVLFSSIPGATMVKLVDVRLPCRPVTAMNNFYLRPVRRSKPCILFERRENHPIEREILEQITLRDSVPNGSQYYGPCFLLDVQGVTAEEVVPVFDLLSSTINTIDVEDFGRDWRYTLVHVETMMRWLQCTRSGASEGPVRMGAFGFRLLGNADANQQGSVKYNTLECSFSGDGKVTCSSNALMKMLTGIPIYKVILEEVEVLDDVYSINLESYATAKELQMFKGSLSSNTMMRLLDCMPAIETMRVGKIIGGLDKVVAVSNVSLKDFTLGGTVRASTLLKLLGCIPSIVSLSLVTIVGEVDGGLVVSRDSLKDFTMCGSVSATTLAKLLACMPHVASVKFYWVNVTGEVDSMTELKSLRECLVGGVLGLKTLMALLQCMPSQVVFRKSKFKIRLTTGKAKEIVVAVCVEGGLESVKRELEIKLRE